MNEKIGAPGLRSHNTHETLNRVKIVLCVGIQVILAVKQLQLHVWWKAA